MKVFQLKAKRNLYTSNAYLVTGEWNAIDDVNTLVDVGADPSVMDDLDEIYTGVGKKKVDQVILTHAHSDHTAILSTIRERYRPVVLAYGGGADGIDRILGDGEMVRMGEHLFEVIHMPAHTEDSILLFNKESGALFVGDSPVIIRSSGGSYQERFVRALKRLCRKNIRTIYFGHGAPLTENVLETLRHSLQNVMKTEHDGPAADVMHRSANNIIPG
jgi:glyoxylase-like metal-dependent hydrolase (beta-lactamase superfamily II)